MKKRNKKKSQALRGNKQRSLPSTTSPKKGYPDALNTANCLLSTSVMSVVCDNISEWYRIKNLETKEVSRIENAPEAVIVTAAENARLKYPDASFSPSKLESIVETYRTYFSGQELPRSFAWKDENVWTLKRLDFELERGRHPAWDDFLNRLSDKDAFMAFVWSVFEMRNKSRQYLWLWGDSGEDGKSTVLRVLASLLGEAAGALNKTQADSASRFLLYSLFDKRAVFYPDCKNTKLGMTELLRNLTSGDVCPIEKKHGLTTAVPIYLKLFVGSNYQPQITGSGADTSRLLLVTVAESAMKDDVTWECRLESELPHFLYSCRERYAALCNHHGKIPLNQNSQILVEESSEVDEEEFTALFNQYFIYTGNEEDYVTGTDFYRTVERHLHNSQRVGNFKTWLWKKYKTRRQDLRHIPLPSGKDRIKGYPKIKLAPHVLAGIPHFPFPKGPSRPGEGGAPEGSE